MTALHADRVPCPMNECWRCQGVAIVQRLSSQMVEVPWKEEDAKKWALMPCRHQQQRSFQLTICQRHTMHDESAAKRWGKNAPLSG